MVNLKQFLASAPNKVVPTQYQSPILTDVLQQLRFTLSLDDQARRVEWSEDSHTMVGVGPPVFTLAAVPVDEAHIYHFLGVTRATGSGSPDWHVRVLYPAMTDRMEEHMESLETRSLNLLSLIPGTSGLSTRNGRPIRVFPGGVVSVEKSSNSTIGFTWRFMFLREVVGAPASSQVVNGVITSSE